MEKKPEHIEYENGNRVLLDEDDSPEWTDVQFARAKNFSDLPTDLQKGLQSLSKRGRPRVARPKKLISFRFDAEIVEHLKEDVVMYNGRVEDLIREAWKNGQL